MNIGDNIKKLRHKNDLTQEKLADFLRVSPQAVSKWECGLACPDLSLIEPLTKLLCVTADELLGLDRSEDDAKREELKAAYDATFRTGCISERMRICESAVAQFPGDMDWLCKYAWDVWCEAIDSNEWGEKFEAEREKVIKMFDTVIENTDDDAVKAHAITGIVGCLCGKGAKAEARRYVELYPQCKADPVEKEKLIGNCLEGEEQVRHMQQVLENTLTELMQQLLWSNVRPKEYAVPAAEAVLEAMIPDGNYFSFHHDMCHIQLRKAELAAADGRSADAEECLKQAAYHARMYDDIDTVNPREYRYTAPLFDKLTHDSRKWCRTGTGTLLDDVRMVYERECFNMLRGNGFVIE